MNERRRQDRRLFKRLLHAHMSLDHAACCVRQILGRNLHDSPRGREDSRLLRCLNTALIVSYASPFSRNTGSEDVAPSLPGKYLDVLDPAERSFHDRIVEARNRDHAHSDPLSLSVRVSVERVFGEILVTPIGRDPFAPLERDDVERLQAILEKLMLRIQVEQQRLAKTFTPDEEF